MMMQSERVNKGEQYLGRDHSRSHPYGVKRLDRSHSDHSVAADDIRLVMLGDVRSDPGAVIHRSRLCYIGLPACGHQGEAP